MLDDKVNILLVDDQPAKLLTYQAILGNVGENLLTASNAPRHSIRWKNDVAVVSSMSTCRTSTVFSLPQ
jgi:response regulator RpfG family c-di-GMP phosphodiesterase